MDVQLKDLIETIKTEGVKEAEVKSASIIEAAEDKAKAIVEAAKKDAEKIVINAKSDAVKFESSGNEALKQASRDLLLQIEKQVQGLFDSLVQAETEKAFSTKVLEESIIAVVKGWSEKGSSDISVLLSESEAKKVESALKSKLASEFKSGVEIKPFAAVEAGFRIAEKDGAAYYNFTAGGFAELLSEFLNPKLAQIMKEAGKE